MSERIKVGDTLYVDIEGHTERGIVVSIGKRWLCLSLLHWVDYLHRIDRNTLQVYDDGVPRWQAYRSEKELRAGRKVSLEVRAARRLLELLRKKLPWIPPEGVADDDIRAAAALLKVELTR